MLTIKVIPNYSPQGRLDTPSLKSGIIAKIDTNEEFIINYDSLTFNTLQKRTMVLTHELGHLFLLLTDKYSEEDILRKEMMAWRIAKSICKPSLWIEELAFHYLNMYFKDYYYDKDLYKLKKIIPLNKGLKLLRSK